MSLDDTIKRQMRRHIATNEFHKKYPDGTVIDIPTRVCDCGKWQIGQTKCKCGKTKVHLDYSDTTGEVFPSNLPVMDM